MEDTRKIAQIAKRALVLFKKHGIQQSLISCNMDIYYTHEETPLDLDKLLAFDDFNFAHDVFGIYRHFNRETLKMENCFSPRCTA